MAEKFRLEISKSAEKQLKVIPRADQGRITRAILTLETDPFPQGTRKLRGYDDVYRLRVGLYRVIYSVNGRQLLVIILKLGHRKDVYRGL